MYQCRSCGHRFRTPRRWRESRGCCFGRPAWEELCACPLCGGAYQQLEEEPASFCHFCH